ncbi:serine protease FAM111A-like [Pelmatolapia mariae]|uniref:serine protease FAM111A-like n=1 Tax=Pelmatolapia mariae TaxID=158779 RepID=UPI002FE5B196
MDPFILQPCVPLYLDGEEICSPEAESMGGSGGEWSSSIISDTPVTVYSNRSEATTAPRKEGRNKNIFMFRSQIPAPRSLRGEWTLPFEGCGKWGYISEYDIFKYSIFTIEGLNPDLLTLPEILQKCLVIFRPVASSSISMRGGDQHGHQSRLKSSSDDTRNMFKLARRPFSQCKKMVKARDCYSVFYIATKGGLNAKKEKSFLKNDALKQFEYLCVYGEKGITAAEALKRDGRFADDLGYFELVNIDDERKTECTDIIDCLDNKKFQICFPQGADTDVAIPGQQKPPHASNNAKRSGGMTSVLDVARQNGLSLTTSIKETGSSVDRKEVYGLLCRQYPRLKRWMESRFPKNSFQEALKYRKESFGKSRQPFTEIRSVMLLLELSESVCLITGSFIKQGTGFVLFDNFVLTNARLFDYWVKSNTPNWREFVNVTVVFNFEDQESDRNNLSAKVFIGDDKLDCVILKLETEKVPPGLLKRFGPVPSDGEACVVGHPGGGVKKMSPTWVVEKERREHAENNDNLEDCEEFCSLCEINQQIKNDPYENIYVTYNTLMYHGSFGSPVFDAEGRVFGLHSGGFFYGFPNLSENVIEYAFPLLTIFENFVDNLKKDGYGEVLERVEEEAKGNPHLENIIASVVGSKQGKPGALLQEVESKTDSEEMAV